MGEIFEFKKPNSEIVGEQTQVNGTAVNGAAVNGTAINGAAVFDDFIAGSKEAIDAAIDQVDKPMQVLALATPAEVKALNDIAEMFDEQQSFSEMETWNGENWKSFFEIHKTYAEHNDMDVWDCFAVTLAKLFGTQFVPYENGQMIVIKPSMFQ